MAYVSEYKKKGICLDNNEKRILRVKRRSVDQRTHRDETFMRQRNVGALTPLRESTNDSIQKNASHLTTRTRVEKAGTTLKKADISKVVAPKEETTEARRNMLQKWKLERELKKKLAKEKEMQKPKFKVCKVNQEKGPSMSLTKTAVSSKVQKDTSLAQRRVTRASTKAFSSKPVTSQSQPVVPVQEPSQRVTRQSCRLASRKQGQKENLRVSKASTRTASIAKTSSKATARAPAVPASPPPIRTPKLPSPSAAQHVTSERGARLQPLPDPSMNQSFAPSQFTFNFQFEPMSPASTQNFLFPGTVVPRGRCSTPTSASRRRMAASPLPLEFSVIQTPKKPLLQAPLPNGSGTSKEDVSYFRNLLTTETSKLNDLCSKWEAVPDDTGLSEDVRGEIRCTVGKAQLLIGQRFKQFSGLVDDCESGLGEKQTRSSDLTGFWEMIYFQVEDVMAMFASLDKLQSNNWVRKESEIASTTIKKVVKKAKAAPKGQASKDREAARERLAAIKASMKARQTRAKATEQTVFEGGFFQVQSPVRSPALHCQAGSPFKNQPLKTGGSHGNTPRVQAYTPKNARRSIQGKLCGALSKLVLGEVATPTRKVTTPVGKMATPIAKMDRFTSELDTPVGQVDTPNNRTATPTSNVAVAVSKQATPKKIATPAKMATPSRTDAESDATPSVFALSTETEKENPFAKYLQPAAPAVVHLNKQAEDFMQTSPQQQLVDLGVRSRPLTSDPAGTSCEQFSLVQDSPDSGNTSAVQDSLEIERVLPTRNTPRTRSRSKSGLLLPDLHSPHAQRSPVGVRKTTISSIFTPPLSSEVTSQLGDDLICFDSPVPCASGEAPRQDSENRPNGTTDRPTCGVAVATVRRSIRLRHHSACCPATADSLSDHKAHLCKTNTSMM